MPINSFEVHGLVVSRLILYDLAVEVKKNLVAYIPLAGIGAVVMSVACSARSTASAASLCFVELKPSLSGVCTVDQAV